MPTSSSYRLDTRTLDKLIKDLPGNVDEAVAKAAFRVEGRAKVRAPVDTGALRASIYVSMKRGGHATEAMARAESLRPEAVTTPLPEPRERAVAHIGPSVNYAEAVELGTHRRPGTPYLQPAVRETEADFKNLLKEALKAMTTYAAMGSALYGALGTIQYSYVSGTGTVTGTLPTWDTLSLQGTAAPYVIFQLQDSLDQYTFGTKAGESADYLVKAVSNRQTPSAQGFAIFDKLDTVLQDAPLSIAGSYPLRVRRMSRVQYRDTDGYWHVGGIFRIDSWET